MTARGAAAVAVESRLFRALAVLRVVVLLNTVAWSVYRDSFDRAVVGWSAVGVMVLWTVGSIVIYAAPVRRSAAMLAVDLGLALAMLLLTPVVKGAEFNATIPGYWIIGALLAWAARFGWRGGGVAGALLGATDLLVRDAPSQQDFLNVFLVLVAGTMVGFVSDSLKEMAADRDLAQREAAAAAERARLARVVHDGVLQVLALVQRRGAELGGDAAELGRLAGEQEHALRTLIRAQDATRSVASGRADLAAALGGFADRPGVEIALPSGAVEMAAPVVGEIVAVVGACLDNVERHVGTGARAWVFLDDLDAAVEVSVRDEGPGIPDGRLVAAAEEGRLGVAESIEGRIRDLGGTASLRTGAQGTEWTFVVAKDPA